MGEEADTIIRRFEIGPCGEDLWFLAHAAMGIVEDLVLHGPNRRD